jgi:hypothetical protein
MRPGGQNGGDKPAILEILKGLKAHLGEELQYLFLTADDTHNEAPSSESDSELRSAPDGEREHFSNPRAGDHIQSLPGRSAQGTSP